MKEFWNTLTSSQRYYLTGGGVFIVAVLIFQFVAAPLWNAKSRTLHAIAVNEKALEQMKALSQEYGILKTRADAVQQALASRSGGFSLFAHLDRKAGEMNLKPHVKYINPLKGAVAGPVEETIAEMRLDSLTMRQLTDFLYKVESPKDFIRISKLSIGRMRENPEYLTATLQVVTYQPSQTGGR